MSEKVFHIYAGKQCIMNCIGEDEFKTTWNTVQASPCRVNEVRL